MGGKGDKHSQGMTGGNKTLTTSPDTAQARTILRGKDGERTKQINLNAPINYLDSKPIRVPNKILEGHVPSATPSNQPHTQQATGMVTATKEKGDGRVLPRELLDNGQGKCDETTATADGDGDTDTMVESNIHVGKQHPAQKGGGC